MGSGDGGRNGGTMLVRVPGESGSGAMEYRMGTGQWDGWGRGIHVWGELGKGY